MKKIFNNTEFIHLITLFIFSVLGMLELLSNGLTSTLLLYVVISLWMSIAFVQARYIKIVRNDLRKQQGMLKKIEFSANQLLHTMQHTYPTPGHPIHHGKEKEKVYH